MLGFGCKILASETFWWFRFLYVKARKESVIIASFWAQETGSMELPFPEMGETMGRKGGEGRFQMY